MRLSFVNRSSHQDEFISLVVAAAILLVAWALTRLIVTIKDRRSRESVRCRTCWYDLRATLGDQCPECGANLAIKGVWLPCQPSRGALVNLAYIWLGIVIAMGFFFVPWFVNNCKTLTANKSLYLNKPASGAFQTVSARLTMSTIDWPLLPPFGMREDQYELLIWGPNRNIHGEFRVLLDPDTLEPYLPDSTKKLSIERAPLTPETLESAIKQMNATSLDSLAQAKLVQETVIVVDELRALARAPVIWLGSDDRFTLASSQESLLAFEYAEAGRQHTRTYAAPDTVGLVPTFILFCLYGLGLLWIRGWWLRRRTSMWQPPENNGAGPLQRSE